MQFTWLSRWQPQLLAVLRIVTALLFIEHGTVKLFSFPTPFEMPGPLPTMLLVAAIIEVVAGALILLGLFTRPAAFIASGQMAIAYWIAHAPQNFWPVANEGDAAILYCFIFLYIAAVGPGAWSLDRQGREARADGPAR
jgi:putative oxidoreductase